MFATTIGQRGMGEMPGMGGGLPERAIPRRYCHWVLMVVAMMLPTILPAARWISLSVRWSRRLRAPALFALGYLAVWIGARAAALATLRALRIRLGGTLGGRGHPSNCGRVGVDPMEAEVPAGLPSFATDPAIWVAGGVDVRAPRVNHWVGVPGRRLGDDDPDARRWPDRNVADVADNRRDASPTIRSQGRKDGPTRSGGTRRHRDGGGALLTGASPEPISAPRARVSNSEGRRGGVGGEAEVVVGHHSSGSGHAGSWLAQSNSTRCFCSTPLRPEAAIPKLSKSCRRPDGNFL